MSEELAPCPFCDGPGEIKSFGTVRATWWYPTCSEEDGCPGIVSEQDEQGGTSCDFLSKEDAIAAWNRRPQSPEVRAGEEIEGDKTYRALNGASGVIKLLAGFYQEKRGIWPPGVDETLESIQQAISSRPSAQEPKRCKHGQILEPGDTPKDIGCSGYEPTEIGRALKALSKAQGLVKAQTWYQEAKDALLAAQSKTNGAKP